MASKTDTSEVVEDYDPSTAATVQADNILRAAGSGLKNYTMLAVKKAILSASLDGIEEAYRAGANFAGVQYRERNAELQAEVERLRRLTAGQWFYADGYDGEACCFSPAEVLDNLDLKPGRHVVRVDVATPLPSIWLAVHVRTNEEMDADETDDREAFTEHATEAEATTALEPRP